MSTDCRWYDLPVSSLAAPSALHARVYEAIAAEVRAGSLRGGDRLPSERDLAERFSVSRVTIRRALLDLTASGFTESHPGRGTFITSKVVSESPNSLMSFSQLGIERGLRPSAQVLQSQTRPATLDEADVFGIAPGAEIFLIERIRLLDGLPVAIDFSRVPLARAPRLPALDFSEASLYAALDEHGCGPERAAYTVRAIAADAEQARHLSVEPAAPLLRTSTMSFDASGRVIELGEMTYRGDRYQFQASLTRTPPARG